jgi:hypothetical protein
MSRVEPAGSSGGDRVWSVHSVLLGLISLLSLAFVIDPVLRLQCTLFFLDLYARRKRKHTSSRAHDPSARSKYATHLLPDRICMSFTFCPNQTILSSTYFIEKIVIYDSMIL